MKNFDENKPVWSRKKVIANRLGKTCSGLDKYIKRRPDFPKKIKDGESRQAPVYFNETEVTKWMLNEQKEVIK